MTTDSPIRLLLYSPRKARRQAVRQCLGEQFSIFEASSLDRLARDAKASAADAVLMIQPEMHELLSEYVAAADSPSCVPVIAIGRRGAKAVNGEAAFGAVAGYLPLENLDELPRLLQRVCARDDRDDRYVNAPVLAPGDEISADVLRASQKLITIGKLTAEIAHEINNPLEAIGHYIYLAQSERGLPEQTRDYLKNAEKELSRIGHVVKQTLSFSKESHEPTSVQMGDLMEEVVALYSRRIREKRIDVIRELTGAHSLHAFPGEVRQVLSNLVSNALEASADGGKLRLRIRNGHRFAGSGSLHAGKDRGRVSGLRITVADTGSGISPDIRRRLGQMFFTTKGQEGTGLGLWVIGSIVKRYGGTMRLKSSTGRSHGTVFHIFFPLDHPLLEAPAPQLPEHGPLAPGRRDNLHQISDHPSHLGNKTASRRSTSDPADVETEEARFSVQRRG